MEPLDMWGLGFRIWGLGFGVPGPYCSLKFSLLCLSVNRASQSHTRGLQLCHRPDLERNASVHTHEIRNTASYPNHLPECGCGSMGWNILGSIALQVVAR